MKKYLVAVRVNENLSSSCTVNMPDSYNPINDSPNIKRSFPILRKAVAERMKDMCTSRWEYEQYAADNTTVMAISYLGEVKIDFNSMKNEMQEGTLQSKVQAAMDVMGAHRFTVDQVIKYLPTSAADMSADDFMMSVFDAYHILSTSQ